MKIEKKNLFTFTGISEKEKRNLEILELITAKGLISRTELSRETGINIVSISNYIKNQIEKNLVFEGGLDVSTGGRKPELVELNNKDNFAIGLDIGSRETKIILTDLSVKTIAKTSLPASPPVDKNSTKNTASAIKEMLAKNSVQTSNVCAIGCSVPEGSQAAIAREIEDALGVNVFSGPPSACAAFGEKRLNKSVKDGVMLYMHSDLGQGIVIKEDAFIGAGPEDKSIEGAAYLRPWDSRLGLAHNAKREMARGVGTEIVKLSGGRAVNITEDMVIEAARHNDEVASIILQNVSINLGLRISYLINIFRPKTVVIGGGIEKAGVLTLDTVKRMVDKLAFAAQADAASIIPSCLGDDAASLGAAALAVREIFLNA